MLESQLSLKQYLIKFVCQYKVYVASLIGIAILAGALEIAVDYKIKEIIDAIALDKSADLSFFLVLFVFYKLMHHGVYFVSRLLDIRYKPIIIEQTVTDIYSRTVQHSLHWFESHLSGEIVNKISDFQSSILALINYFLRAFSIIAIIIITLFFLISVNALSALVIDIFILIYSPIIYGLLKKQMVIQEDYIHSRQETIGIINDFIANIFGIKIIGNLATELQSKLNPAIAKWIRLDKKIRKFDTYFIDNADTFMVTLMSAVQIYLLAYLYQNDQITAGGFAFIAMMTLKIHTQLNGFLENLLFNINPSIAQVKASYALINCPIDVADHLNAQVLNQVKGAIQYQDVHFSYGDNNKTVLTNFNLNIKAGERLGLVGPSGAGKTTLIKSLLRYFDINSGVVLVDGHNIQNLTQESLRKAIAVIPQDITLFHRSLHDNLKLAKADASDDDIIAACASAKIHDDIMKMPQGYDTIVGERGVKLSGGQRQRIAIARAILKNAPILILDEATSSLDTPTEQLIQASISHFLKTSNATVIAIAHRLSTLKHMDRIVVLDQGNIVEEGTHAALINKKDGRYQKLWQMQAI